MSAEEEKPEQEEPAEETNDLREPLWAVIAFDGCLASNLTYSEASELVASLSEEEKPGLCIVTNSAAQRLKAGTLSGK